MFIDHTVRFWKERQNKTNPQLWLQTQILDPQSAHNASGLGSAHDVPHTQAEMKYFSFLGGTYSQVALYKALKIQVGRERDGGG